MKMTIRFDILSRCMLAVGLLFVCQQALALSWADLWARPDQQGAALLAEGKASEAVQHFENKSWRAVALYRSGRYNDAVKTLQEQKTAIAHYNRANSLAHMGQYKKAIAAYTQSLQLQPHNEDARYNRELLKQLLKQREQQNQRHPRQQQQKKNKEQQQNAESKANQQKKKQNKNDQSKQSQGQQNKQSQKNKQQPDQGLDKQQQAKKQQTQSQKQQSKEQHEKQNKQSKNKQQREQSKPQQQQQSDKTSQSKKNKQHAKQNNQWLRRIQDDPGGLLRRKFMRDHMRRQTQ